jgi:Predicted Zn peptidase
MSNIITAVNKKMLIWARNYYGLTRDQVAEGLKVNKEKIIAWEEDGNEYPTYVQLKKISTFFKKPIIVFFMNEFPLESGYQVACRSNPNISSLEINKKLREMFDMAFLYKLNLDEFYHDRITPMFYEKIANDDVTNSSLCEWLRKELALTIKQQKEFKRPSDLLEYVRNSFYNIGIYIFKDSFRTNDVSGLCLYDSKFPIILVNNKMSFTRQLFTVFHEIYHLFHARASIEYLKINEEQDCDNFASEFLLPNVDFNNRIKGLHDFENEDLINQLATEYKISRDAIGFRLHKIGKISSSFYFQLREMFLDDVRQMNSANSGGNYYTTKMNYLGKSYLNSVFKAYYSGEISIQQVGRFTNLKTSSVSGIASVMTGGKI